MPSKFSAPSNALTFFRHQLFADGEVRFNPTDLHAANYHIMGLDLRNLDEVENKLRQAEVDFSIPTIILAECVLVYIEANYCANLLKWLSSHFPSAVFVNYEQVSAGFRIGVYSRIFTFHQILLQVNMNDRFGDVMLNNLRSRGCSLAGVEACTSLESQVKR